MLKHSASEDRDQHPRRPLAIALGITLAFLIIEVIGGVLTNSLALLADAGHMATDVGALALSLGAVWLAQRPPTPQRTYGLHRAEVLASLVNAATLVAISLYIFWEALKRFGDPVEVNSGPMLVIAVGGLLANAASAWVLSRGGGHEHNLNTRGAYLHVVGDMLGSVGAIVAALIMLATGWYLADPLLSAGIGLLILWSSWRLLGESVDVLLEGTPRGIDLGEVRKAMRETGGVTGVHDLHVWTVTSGFIALTAHVEIASLAEWQAILPALQRTLREQFGIPHVTLQPEPADARGERDDRCSLDTPEGREACLAVTRVPDPAVHAGHRH